MSLPDILLDVPMVTGDTVMMEKPCNEEVAVTTTTTHELKPESCTSPSPHSSSHSTATNSSSRCSMISVDSCDSDCLSEDEGEADWDGLGRMSSIRRSNRFDKPQLLTINITRGPDGYGLELQGRSPPTIINLFGPSAESGMRCGDKVLEINSISVRGISHEEAGRMIAQEHKSITFLIHSVKPTEVPHGQPIHSGWLFKRGGTGMTPRNWRRRWFVLRDDCIAYYYCHPSESRPRGAIVLRNYTVSRASHRIKKPFAFQIMKGGGRPYYFCAESDDEMKRWAQVFTEAATLEGRESVCFSSAAHNVSLSALSIKDPDCHGFLHKRGNNIKTWKRRYCVLKACQLFYYGKMTHTTAYGVMNLKNYELTQGHNKVGKFYFHASPVRGEQRTYYFFAESDGERERWMKALRRCIKSSLPV